MTEALCSAYSPHEAIAVEAINLVVLLACGQPMGLLPTMISPLKRGLQKMVTQFHGVQHVKDKDDNLILKTHHL